jgi:hypothetical protein
MSWSKSAISLWLNVLSLEAGHPSEARKGPAETATANERNAMERSIAANVTQQELPESVRNNCCEHAIHITYIHETSHCLT